MKEKFEQIYRNDEWGQGSGEGSVPVYTLGYISFLQTFLRQNNIQSVVDLGCGDWQFSRFVDWGDIDYYGCDLVESVIETNQRNYSRSNVSFHLLLNSTNEQLPEADLLIAKDVLQHWSNELITAFIPNLAKFPMSLITNCINPHGPTDNHNIPDGEFRPLDLRLPPFNLKAVEVFSFSNSYRFRQLPSVKHRWTKKVLLIRSEAFQ